jgi:hypothetical protein
MEPLNTKAATTMRQSVAAPASTTDLRLRPDVGRSGIGAAGVAPDAGGGATSAIV